MLKIVLKEALSKPLSEFPGLLLSKLLKEDLGNIMKPLVVPPLGACRLPTPHHPTHNPLHSPSALLLLPLEMQPIDIPPDEMLLIGGQRVRQHWVVGEVLVPGF